MLKNEMTKGDLFEDDDDNSHSSNSSSVFKRKDKNKKNLDKLKSKNQIDENSDQFGFDKIKPNKKNDDFFSLNDTKLSESNKKEFTNTSEFPPLNSNFQNSKLFLLLKNHQIKYYNFSFFRIFQDKWVKRVG